MDVSTDRAGWVVVLRDFLTNPFSLVGTLFVVLAAFSWGQQSWRNAFDLLFLWLFGVGSPAYVAYRLGQRGDGDRQRLVFRVTMSGALCVIIALRRLI